MRKEEEEGEQVKGRRCCWRRGGWGPGEADQIGALEISHVGALWGRCGGLMAEAETSELL